MAAEEEQAQAQVVRYDGAYKSQVLHLASARYLVRAGSGNRWAGRWARQQEQ